MGEAFEEEYPWGIALYLELSLGRDKTAVVCRHPSYTVVKDVKRLAEEVYRAGGDEISALLTISRLLDEIEPSWRKDFEIVVRRSFLAVTVYL